ncbi:MAG TPA: hypothetical protein VM008_13460 [Phycisphaerae bacterium]|nr:hypothetical protein [Phycisphaerae bacterium]
MSTLEFYLLITFAQALAWAAVLLPSLFFLIFPSGWKARRDKIFCSFSTRALKLYYQLYFPECVPDADKLFDRFRSDFGKYHGRRNFVVPYVLLTIAASVGLWGTAQSVAVWMGVGVGGLAFPPLAVASFMGGYTWVLFDHQSRRRSGDFTPGDLANGVFRLIIAIPFGYALTAFASTGTTGPGNSMTITGAIPLAFLIGVFPTNTVFTIARRIASKQLGLGEDNTAAANELEILQNVGKTNAERFQDEGVTTIAELAWTDPIDLSIRTNFDFNYVVDCMSQSLLAIYIGSDIKKLSPVSLRGAQEVRALVMTLQCDPADETYSKIERDAAQGAVNGAAKILGFETNVNAFFNTLLFVAEDPYTEFLWEIWGNACDDSPEIEINRTPWSTINAELWVTARSFLSSRKLTLTSDMEKALSQIIANAVGEMRKRYPQTPPDPMLNAANTNLQMLLQRGADDASSKNLTTLEATALAKWMKDVWPFVAPAT